MKIRSLALPLLALFACSEPKAIAPAAQAPPPRDEIHGRVLRSDGTPVAGAKIQLTRMEGLQEHSERANVREQPHGEAVATVLSARDGGFRFSGPLRGNHRLDLTDDDVQEHRFAVPAGDFVEFILGSGCRIEGRLRCHDHKQEVFTGQVWLSEHHAGGILLLAAPISPDGSFHFDSLPPRHYHLLAEVDGHDSYEGMGGVRPVSPGETVRIVIEVAEDVERTGRVEDKQSESSWPLVKIIRGKLLDAAGLPVPGARIAASAVKRYYEITSSYRQSAVSDAHGDFTIPWPDEQEASLLIQTSDLLEYHLYLGLIATDAPVREIRLPTLTVWNLRLQDDSGSPVANVELGRDRTELSGRPPREGEPPATHAAFIERRTTSDSFGRCQFITDGTWPVMAGVFLSWSRHWVLPLQPGGGDQVLTLDNLRRAPIRVLTADREPAEDFFLMVLDAEHSMPEFESGQGGVKDLGNLFAPSAGGMAYVEGKFQREVSIVIQGYFVPEYRQDGVALDAGPIEIVLPWTATCTGRVTDASGKPVRGATVHLVEDGNESPCAETDADGKFSVILQKGKFYALVAVDAAGRRSEPVGAATNTSGLVLQIKE